MHIQRIYIENVQLLSIYMFLYVSNLTKCETVLIIIIYFSLYEIDGKALLLLKSDVIMKYMGLKLGPALKLCYYIEKLKEGKYN